MTKAYSVELDVFEGPLDLLLYLIKKDEVDIYDIPIERITAQYMDYLSMMRMLDLNMAGEFIVMAATLMLIKSRMLLPKDEIQDEEEDEEDDPRWDLVRQLVEYKRFKDAAGRLHERELMQEGIFFLGQPGADLPRDEDGSYLEDVNIFDLLTAFQKVLERVRPEAFGEIEGLNFSVEDKVDVILSMTRKNAKVAFSELFPEAPYRDEVICTFLAVLELMRLCQIVVVQSRRFGEIFLQGVLVAQEG